MKSGNQNRNYM